MSETNKRRKTTAKSYQFGEFILWVFGGIGHCPCGFNLFRHLFFRIFECNGIDLNGMYPNGIYAAGIEYRSVLCDAQCDLAWRTNECYDSGDLTHTNMKQLVILYALDYSFGTHFVCLYGVVERRCADLRLICSTRLLVRNVFSLIYVVST